MIKTAKMIAVCSAAYWILSGCQPATSEAPSPVVQTPPARADNWIATARLSNPSDFIRRNQPLYLSLNDLGLGPEHRAADALMVEVDGNPIPSQLIDRDGDGTKDGLFTLLDIAPGATVSATVKMDDGVIPPGGKLTQAEISRKVGGEWQPREDIPQQYRYVGGSFENVQTLTPPSQHSDQSTYIRYEGPGIESDKVGYRIYLDERNGFDIFGKKVHDMVLDAVGQNGFDAYHRMDYWGMDILAVGESLGVGGYGYWNGQSAERVSEVENRTASVVENGELYSALQLRYDDWRVAGKTVDLSADLSMHGGSRMVHARVKLSDALPNLAIGLPKHSGGELLEGTVNTAGNAYTYVATWGRQTLSNDHLGMALLFRRGDRQQQTSDTHNHISVMVPDNGDLEYYFLAAWEAEMDGIKTKEAFIDYLERQAEKLTLQPRQRLQTRYAQNDKNYPVNANQALRWSQQMADSALKRDVLQYASTDSSTKAFSYDHVGLMPLAYDELNKRLPKPRYRQVIHHVTGSFVTDQGDILGYRESDYDMGSIAPGRVLLRLYEETGADKYRIAADQLRHQLNSQPRTSDGAFGYRQRYDSQLWLDGVYMGMPFLARYTHIFENGDSLEEVVREFVLARRHLRDEETGLYYHAWDEKKQQTWADHRTGASKHHWGRGYGWFAMAVVDVLDYIPEQRTALRQPLLDIVEEIAQSLERHQDSETGTWWHIMDMPDTQGNYREASSTAMFTYFLAKALNQHYLPTHYQPIAQKAYDGLIEQFVLVHRDGSISLTNICKVAGLGDGSYRYYLSEPIVKNDPKGTAPFILAGIEMHDLLRQTRGSGM